MPGGPPEFGPAFLDLVHVQAGPLALIDLAERTVDLHLESVRLGDRARRIDRSLEVARIHRLDRKVSQILSDRHSLPVSFGIEFDVRMPLRSLVVVPLG